MAWTSLSRVTLWGCPPAGAVWRWLPPAAAGSGPVSVEFQRRVRDLSAHAGGPGDPPTSFSSSRCLGFLTLGLHPRACMRGLGRPSQGACCGRSRASGLAAESASCRQCSHYTVLGAAHVREEGAWLAGSASSGGELPPAPRRGSQVRPRARHTSHFLPLRGGPAFQKPSRLFVVDRRCELFPKTSHHEEKGASFCLHLGLRVPYNVAKGNISQISVKLIIKLQYPHKSICSRC